MKNVLVTGANGFVGKNLTPRLRDVYSDVEFLTPSSKELNLIEYEDLLKYLHNNNVQEVIHLASSMAGIGELQNKPLLYLENNLIMNYNIIHASLEAKIKKFVTLGTSCSYNNSTPLPMRERDLWCLKPENTYGICKLIMLEHLYSQEQMKWVYLIPGNLYGPHDHFGEENAHIIPATVQKIEKIEKETPYIEVWGDGSQIRDFMYVGDAVDIICKAYDDGRYYGHPINISTAKGTTIKTIVEEITRCFQNYEDCVNNLSVRWDKTKPIGIKEKILANDEFLKLEPGFQFTTIPDGISKTMNWYGKRRKCI